MVRRRKRRLRTMLRIAGRTMRPALGASFFETRFALLRMRRQSRLLCAADQPDVRLGLFQQAAISGEIVERHPPRGKARLEVLADRAAVEARQAIDGGHRADLVLDNEASEAGVDDFR